MAIVRVDNMLPNLGRRLPCEKQGTTTKQITENIKRADRIRNDAIDACAILSVELEPSLIGNPQGIIYNNKQDISPTALTDFNRLQRAKARGICRVVDQKKLKLKELEAERDRLFSSVSEIPLKTPLFETRVLTNVAPIVELALLMVAGSCR